MAIDEDQGLVQARVPREAGVEHPQDERQEETTAESISISHH